MGPSLRGAGESMTRLPSPVSDDRSIRLRLTEVFIMTCQFPLETPRVAFLPTPSRPVAPTGEHEGPGPFGRLVQIYRDNDQLLAALKAVAARIDDAGKYLAAPGSHAAFGAAHLARLKARRSGLLAQLRANRTEVDGLLGGALSDHLTRPQAEPACIAC